MHCLAGVLMKVRNSSTDDAAPLETHQCQTVKCPDKAYISTLNYVLGVPKVLHNGIEAFRYRLEL